MYCTRKTVQGYLLFSNDSYIFISMDSNFKPNETTDKDLIARQLDQIVTMAFRMNPMVALEILKEMDEESEDYKRFKLAVDLVWNMNK